MASIRDLLPGLFRGGDKGNPVSRFGDRVGRRVGSWINDRVGGNSERAYNRYMEDLYAQEGLPLLARPESVSRGVPDALRPSPEQMGPSTSLMRPYVVPNYTPEPRSGGPTVNGRQMTQAELDRYAADPRSILNQRNQQQNPMDPVNRGPVSQYRDLSAVTRRGGESATDRAAARAQTAMAARSMMDRANRID